jgi:DNA adenine methylase
VTVALSAEKVAARGRPAPFLKWAGGKRQILPRLLKVAPRDIATYYEPFVGGGALFFALADRGLFRRAVLGDQNQELIVCYRALQADVDGVIRELRKLRASKDEYYRVRDIEPGGLAPAVRAARTIYLNKVGFNGLYRVNSRGKFNVPMGRSKRPNFCDEGRLKAVHEALNRTDVQLLHGDFDATVQDAGEDDFVYFDPPYVPLSATSNFTAYAQNRFGPDEQHRLAATLHRLGQRRVPALLSNSDCRETRQLYRSFGFKGVKMVQTVQVRRAINSVATRRGPVGEILVKSFQF